MARIEIGKHLAVDSRTCGGHLIFNGSRIPVAHALEMIAAEYSFEDVSKQYRGIISPAAVREAQTLVARGVLKEEMKKIRAAA
jgi:uncharacterized protein (DUF433 family)